MWIEMGLMGFQQILPATAQPNCVSQSKPLGSEITYLIYRAYLLLLVETKGFPNLYVGTPTSVCQGEVRTSACASVTWPFIYHNLPRSQASALHCQRFQ